jgi:GntP family gluconate:H+ symporter
MNSLLAAAEPAAISNWPVAVFLISVGFIVIAITKFRMHAFVALILAALLAGWLTGGPEGYMVAAIGSVSSSFGATAAGVGIVIALAALIGMCLLDSGAADRIVRTFVNAFGEKRAGWALLASGFVLSIPVFFDTMFFLVIPLARMLALRTGKNYLFYVMCIGAGGAITHSIVPPTPGPLLVGNELNLQLGTIIIAGIVAGLPPAIIAMYFARWLDGRNAIPVRAADGVSEAEMKEAAARPESELPSFGASILPIVLPVLLLGAYSFVDMIEEIRLRGNTEIVSKVEAQVSASLPGDVSEADKAGAVKKAIEAEIDRPAHHSKLHAITKFLGDKIIALGLGALLSMLLLMKQARLTWADIGDRCGGPLETAGVIILITSAGGAFGKMIKQTGIADVMQHYGEAYQINYILLAWIVTALVRIAQGSATVSMITGVGLMSGLLQTVDLPYHVAYIYLAIGFGSITCSWMNDSGFWIVGRLSGFTERETLKSWTPMLTLIAVVGLVETLVVSMILPFK